MQPPQEFRAACDRYAACNPTKDDIAVLTSLITTTPLPAHLNALKYGFSPDTRAPTTPGAFHDYKNHARAREHARRDALLDEALSAALTKPPKQAAFIITPASKPALQGFRHALREALRSGCNVEWHVPRGVLHGAGLEFVGAVVAAGFVAVEDLENGRIVFRMGDLTDLQLFWLFVKWRCGHDVLPAGEVVTGGERFGGVGRWLVRLLVRVI